MSSSNEMEKVVARADRLVEAVMGAILASTEVAAERLELASRLAQLQGRMAAFGALLEALGSARAQVLVRLGQAQGPARALLETQLAALGAQELAALEMAGVPQQTAAAAL